MPHNSLYGLSVNWFGMHNINATWLCGIDIMHTKPVDT